MFKFCELKSNGRTACKRLTTLVLLVMLAIYLLNWLGNVSEFQRTLLAKSSFYSSDNAKTNVSQDHAIGSDPTVQMDDLRLIRLVQKKLTPPSTSPYNFNNSTLIKPGANPSAGQTQAVADILRGFGEDGFFVEVGANNGEWYTNTLWTEKTLGWKGLLIEADPVAFNLLKNKNRNAWMGHFCLSNHRKPQIMPFYLDKGGALGSGLIKSKKYRAVKPVNVQCFPLYTVLLAVNRTTVDYFSLDVEGNEIDVLNTVPFDKVVFKVITIEHVFLREGKAGLRSYMERHGYIFFRTVVTGPALDTIFIHKSVKLTDKQKARIGEENSDLVKPARKDN